MLLRLAVPDDALAIRHIYNAEVRSDTTFDMVPRTLGQQRSWLVDRGAAYPVVVAVVESEVVGFASLSRYHDRPAYAPTVEDSVYVAHGARGCGVGRSLLDDLLERARAHGFHSVIARIVGTNAASVALHRACGFDPVGVEREVGRKHGRWLDVAVMQKLISSRQVVPPGGR